MAVHVNTGPAELAVHSGNYHRFMLMVKWVCVHAAALISFLTVWFATPAGFGWGLIVGAIVLAVGIFAMTHGLNHSSEPEPPAGR